MEYEALGLDRASGVQLSDLEQRLSVDEAGSGMEGREKNPRKGVVSAVAATPVTTLTPALMSVVAMGGGVVMASAVAYGFAPSAESK
jgi:hypothetical protein